MENLPPGYSLRADDKQVLSSDPVEDQKLASKPSPILLEYRIRQYLNPSARLSNFHYQVEVLEDGVWMEKGQRFATNLDCIGYMNRKFPRPTYTWKNQEPEIAGTVMFGKTFLKES